MGYILWGSGHGAVLKVQRGGKTIRESGFNKDILTHVPYGEDNGSVEKAYLITRELNE